MKIPSIAIIAVMVPLLIGCTDGVSPTNLELPVEFSLKYGSAVTIDGGQLTITFVGPVSDSRCPTDVVCFWPGDAHVSLRLLPRGGEPTVVRLGVFGAELDTLQALNYLVDTLGYEFSLRSLSPYPEDPDHQTPLSDFVARIRVKKSVLSEREVIITDTPPRRLLLGSYQIDSAEVADDTLAVWVSYGGGCQIHEFRLFMSPAVFAESSPVQADLYLQHIDHFDLCEALLSERLDFDVSAIAEVYRELYQTGGTVRLNLFEYNSGAITSDFHVLYEVP